MLDATCEGAFISLPRDTFRTPLHLRSLAHFGAVVQERPNIVESLRNERRRGDNRAKSRVDRTGFLGSTVCIEVAESRQTKYNVP